jgi:hypothetical protein
MKDHTQYAELLPLYAVGALGPAEESELQAHLQSCTECQGELATLRGDAALLALSAVGPAPPQRARHRLLAAVENEPRQQPVSQRPLIGTLPLKWPSLAPIAAALLLAIFSLMLWRVNDRLQRKLDRTQAELQQVQDELSRNQQIITLLHSPDSKHMTLVGTKNVPQPLAQTVYSAKMGRLFMMASHLDPLPNNKVYQLWLLPMKDGPPMACGTFWPDAKGGAMMDYPMPESGIEAKGFAVTIEPQGGSDKPTSPIQMSNPG